MPSRRLYIDWSGDPGFKTGRGASRMIVVSIVQPQSYEALQESVAKLRSTLHVSPTFEFHWAKIGWRERDAYVEMTGAVDFTGWVLIVDKTTIHQDYEHLTPNEVMHTWIAELFAQIPEESVSGAELVIDDGTKGHTMASSIRVAVSSRLRGLGLERRIRSARGMPAHRNEALQLADMVAGAARAWKIESSRDYLRYLSQKVVVINHGG